jgi:hypothetical protein
VFRSIGKDSFSMNPHGNGKNEPTDPDQLVRLIDLELAQKRAARQQAPPPYRSFRLLSFVFIFVIIAGAAFAFYYLFIAGGLEQMRSHKEPTPAAVPASTTP